MFNSYNWGFPYMGCPIAEWFMSWKILSRWMIFRGTPISGNIQLGTQQIYPNLKYLKYLKFQHFGELIFPWYGVEQLDELRRRILGVQHAKGWQQTSLLCRRITSVSKVHVRGYTTMIYHMNHMAKKQYFYMVRSVSPVPVPEMATY